MAQAERWCIICDAKRVKARDRCGTCLQYLHRKGHDRPQNLVEKQVELNNRPEPVRATVIRQLVRILDTE